MKGKYLFLKYVFKNYHLFNYRLTIFKSSLQKAFRTSRSQSLSLERIKEIINEEHSSNPFRSGEITAALHKMEEDNQIMLTDGIVFLI